MFSEDKKAVQKWKIKISLQEKLENDIPFLEDEQAWKAVEKKIKKKQLFYMKLDYSYKLTFVSLCLCMLFIGLFGSLAQKSSAYPHFLKIISLTKDGMIHYLVEGTFQTEIRQTERAPKTVELKTVDEIKGYLNQDIYLPKYIPEGYEIFRIIVHSKERQVRITYVNDKEERASFTQTFLSKGQPGIAINPTAGDVEQLYVGDDIGLLIELQSGQSRLEWYTETMAFEAYGWDKERLLKFALDIEKTN